MLNSLPITIASDHAGFELKQYLIENLQKSGYTIEDLGCDNAETSVDYPDFANKLCEKIIAKKSNRGILICGSGVGISIAANRFKEIRAALCMNDEMAKLSRKHNDANVICFGARLISKEVAFHSIKVFLTTEFEGGRHENRVRKLSK